MKKIIVYGPAKHVFAQFIMRSSQEPGTEITAEVIDNYDDLMARLPKVENEILILINRTNNEAWGIKIKAPKARVIVCHGGAEGFKPNLILIDINKNHQYFSFADWPDFWNKIFNPPLDLKPLLTAEPETNDSYLVNYENFPELAERQSLQVDKKFFWFSVYFSRVYLTWFAGWLQEVFKMQFPLNINLSGSGKVKRLNLAFANKHKGELIFREGEEIVFQTQESDWFYYYETVTFQDRRKHGEIAGKIIAADEESLEIIFIPALPKEILQKYKFFMKGGNLLDMMVKAYTNALSGYADLSLNDYIYFQENHYFRPEDFLRGYIPNLNGLHLPNFKVQLDGPSKVILYDQSQIRALIDIIGPSFLTMVKGPPGTGKTLLTAVAIKQFLLTNKIVVVAAHSNQALDNILETLGGHIDSRRIFRLGNDPHSITSTKTKAYHRHFKYHKEVTADRNQYEKKYFRIENNHRIIDPPFNTRGWEVDYENSAIWKLICSGQGLVIALTINSFLFDNSLRRLFSQNFQITLVNQTNTSDFDIPDSVVKIIKADTKSILPQFMIDVTMIDEATKGRFFEFAPLIKATDSKLVLIGDTDQLGNIELTPEAKAEMIEKINDNLSKAWSEDTWRLYPSKDTESKYEHQLSPLETNPDEIKAWFENFSWGMFYSLVVNGRLPVNELNINRRSLPKITKFLNYVFDKDLQVGRFNPATAGRVTFLDVASVEARIKTSYKNRKEISIIGREVIQFFQGQKKTAGKIKLSSLGIIATYRGQVKAIREDLRQDLIFHKLFAGLITPDNIDEVLRGLVNTVDAFQGSERETIIVSLVRANSDGQIGFSSDIRRLYVALSRAKNELIVVGHASTFLKSSDKKIKKIFGRIIHVTQIQKTYSLKIIQ